MSAVLSAGCGSVNNSGHLPDAPPGGDDAAAMPGTVRVTVLDPAGTGAPAVGASVVFFDPDGSLVKKVATDSAGKASAEVRPGASVTSIVLGAQQYQLETVLSVVPGDDLVLGSKTGDGAVAGEFTVGYPAFGTTPSSYSVIHPCGTTSFPAPATGAPPSPGTITIYNSCKKDPMEIVIVPYSVTGPLTSLARSGIAFVPGGSTTITGNYQGLRSFTGSYTNIPSRVTTLTATRGVPDDYSYTESETFSPPGATATLQLTGVQASGGQMVTTAEGDAGQLQVIRQTIAGTAATYGLDVGATLLPWLDMPTYDAASRTIRVVTTAAGAGGGSPDLFQMVVTYAHVNNSVRWVISGPAPADAVLPALPADLAELLPGAADTVTINAAGMFDADTVAGYAAIRNDVNAALAAYTGARPPATTVRTSRINIRRR